MVKTSGNSSKASGRERRALAYALAAVALWSTVATAFKLALEELAPLQLLLVAVLVSMVFFWCAAAVSIKRFMLPAVELRRAFLFGLLNPFAYYVILFEAYDRLPAQIAQPINYTWAIVLAILAVPILGQRLARRALSGILISYFGVLVLLTQGSFSGMQDSNWPGILLALASTVVWALYWLFNTKSRSEPIALMAWSFTFAAPFVAAACWLGPGWPALGPRSAALGIWVGIVEMGLTFLLWQRALRLTDNAGRIGQLIFISPFASLVLIGLVLREDIHVTSFAGLAIIVTGVLITQRARD